MTLSNHTVSRLYDRADNRRRLLSLSPPGDFLDRDCWSQEHRCPLESWPAGCLLSLLISSHADEVRRAGPR